MEDTKSLYERAKNQSNFRAIFENQREKLKEVLENDLIYPYNGGYFILNIVLFLEIRLFIAEGKESAILLDSNKNPIQVNKLDDFYTDTRTLYSEAINKYYTGIQRLKKSRKVLILTNMHELSDDIES